ncbi:glycosyltransferase [Paenibacillus sacheonensis]|uniref:Glycosyltransferase n=1 Tax=Paenibacillus sacheonensis TaxID=742054 RepID=A0A7X4YX54_9BACL|nr:GT2 family glycosyltransferase [Paenibacillus sacheonensis]NBC73191.1 glycosyltransferase [Paenibacillus sacheonensis]
MKSAPTASVCIVTYNSESDIAACLEAVLSLSYPLERIVIVDNASSDNSCGVVRRFLDNVHLVENKANVGFAQGQNQAIALTSTDYVLTLNPDVRLDPNYLGKLIEVMESDRRIGSATGQLVLGSDPNIIDSTGIVMGKTRRVWDRGGGDPSSKWQESGELFGVSAAAAVYARRMIDDIKLDGQFFDETYFAYKEDVDVAWRAKLLGWKAYYAAEAKASHGRGWKYEGRKSRKSVPLFIRRHSYQNRIFTIIKNEPANWTLLLTIPRLLGLELLQVGYMLVFEPGLLKCWLTIARALPRLLGQRKSIQRRVFR